jgi:hypothetical protein
VELPWRPSSKQPMLPIHWEQPFVLMAMKFKTQIQKEVILNSFNCQK